MSLDDALRELAERQHALVSREQARELGTTRKSWHGRVAGPDWDLVTRRVMRLVGAPWTPERPIMAAVLDSGPGTAASYRTAAALWRLPGFDMNVIECS